MSEDARRQFITNYAVHAVQSGRLTALEAVGEAIAEWDKRMATEQKINEVLDLIDQIDQERTR